MTPATETKPPTNPPRATPSVGEDAVLLFYDAEGDKSSVVLLQGPKARELKEYLAGADGEDAAFFDMLIPEKVFVVDSGKAGAE